MSTSDKMRQALHDANVTRRFSGAKVQRLVGFWVMLHTVGQGSYRQLDLTGYYGSNVIRTHAREFRRVFGVDALEWYPELAKMLRDSEEQQP